MKKLKWGEKPHPRLQWWFRKYNKKYFGGKLLSVPCYVCLLDGTVMACVEGANNPDTDEEMMRILVDPKKHPYFCQAQVSLLHEMCHLALHPDIKHGHGPKWKREVKRIMKLGAFDDLI